MKATPLGERGVAFLLMVTDDRPTPWRGTVDQRARLE
jgi:hypothetical protein